MYGFSSEQKFLHALGCTLILLSVLLLVGVGRAGAANSDFLYGYAWSDTIGWISFNGPSASADGNGNCTVGQNNYGNTNKCNWGVKVDQFGTSRFGLS